MVGSINPALGRKGGKGGREGDEKRRENQ